MSVQLEKLVEDVREETTLWPIEDAQNTAEEEAAWSRVGTKNKMTGAHVKSIFKVLSKKYEAEKIKPRTDWKLFEYLKFLDKKKETNPYDYENSQDDEMEEGDEFVELLEVNEEYCSDDDEPNTSETNSSRNVSMEDVKSTVTTKNNTTKKVLSTESTIAKKEGTAKKVPEKLNENGYKNVSLIKPVEQPAQKKASQLPSGLVKVPIRLVNNSSICIQKKSLSALSSTNQTIKQANEVTSNIEDKLSPLQKMKEVKNKRKAQHINKEEDHESNSPPIKRQLVIPKGIKVLPSTLKNILSNTSTPESPAGNATISSTNPINTLSSPTEKLPPFSSILRKSPTLQDDSLQSKGKSQSPSPISSVMSNNCSMNGIDIKKEKLDREEAKLEIAEIKKDRDENTEIKVKVLTEQAEKILPAFFRDLYNSKKYDSFGMYVSSTMNRLPSYLASKLEAKILQSIIEINSLANDEDCEQM